MGVFLGMARLLRVIFPMQKPKGNESQGAALPAQGKPSPPQLFDHIYNLSVLFYIIVFFSTTTKTKQKPIRIDFSKETTVFCDNTSHFFLQLSANVSMG